jgi:4-hydroxybenzoate adenylyltransferase
MVIRTSPTHHLPPLCEPTGNLVQQLARIASERGWLERVAYVENDTTQSFAEVYEGAARSAAALHARGVQAGDRVFLALPDGIDFVHLFLGAMRLGAVAVPVNWQLHPNELLRCAQIAEPVLTVCEPTLVGQLPGPAVAPDDLRGDPRSDPAPPPYASCDPGTAAFAVFTSGTTSAPRLCVHTHGDPTTFAKAIGSVLEVGPSDVCFSVSRMYFAYGLGNSVFLPLRGGASTVLSPRRADEAEALTAIREHQVSVFYGQPSFYARMLNHPDHAVLKQLRLAVVAGEVLPPALENRLRQEVLGDRLLNVFGTTEIGHALIANTPTQQRAGTIGRILPPYRMRIVDAAGTPVPPDVEGSLEVAGPTIALGSARGSDRPVRTGENWYPTGDAATVDVDGFVRLHGRLDDIEIVAGTNVHPAEVEDLLLRHPDVQEAGVCSLRDRAGVSALHAFVVPRPGHADLNRVRRQLLGTARTDLSPHKIPRDVEFVEALPRTPVGKLNRRDLRGWCAR